MADDFEEQESTMGSTWWVTLAIAALKVVGSVISSIFGAEKAKGIATKVKALEARLATIEESYETEQDIKDGQRAIKDDNRDKTEEDMLKDLNADGQE